MKKLSKVVFVGMVVATNAMAEVDLNVGGKGAIYYQTNNSNNNNFLSQENSSANVGLQLDLKSDLGNGFGLGYQETFLGTLGLEKSMVSNVRQHVSKDDLNAHSMTKLYVTKVIDNTQLKLGRQELPKSLSPLAFSESWNVFKNTFDAMLIVNQDIVDTTLVGAYVSGSNHHDSLATFNDLSANSATLGNGKGTFTSGAYMLTIVNKSIDKLPITASYYALKDIANLKSGSAVWLDIKANQMPVKFAFQVGQIDPSNHLKETTAFGAKFFTNVEDVALSLAYSFVNDGDVSLQNVGTGVKTPLYTQMIGNQNFISSNSDSVVLKGSIKLPMGRIIAQYDITKDNSSSKNNYQELDLIYKFNALGTNMLLAYIGQKTNNKTFSSLSANSTNNLRFWTRYNF